MTGRPDGCTCGPDRNSDGSENGMCDFCDQEARDERFGNRDMLNGLHAAPQICDSERAANHNRA